MEMEQLVKVLLAVAGIVLVLVLIGVMLKAVA